MDLAYHVGIDIFIANVANSSTACQKVDRMNPVRIAILAFDGCMGTEVFAVSDVLLIARHVAASARKGPRAAHQIELIGLAGQSVTMAGGISVGVKRPSGKYALLVVPGMEVGLPNVVGAALSGLTREAAFIGKSFSAGTPVASVCIGAFLLGEAGLIAGRRVTTSWLMAPQLAARYPRAQLDAAQMLIEDGAVTTTGGVSAAFDLALHIVKRVYGARVASATARIALLQEARTSQAPYVDRALQQPGTASFSQAVLQWLADRLAENYDLQRLALAFHVSARTLLRRVKAETGQSPLTLLQQARVDKAKRLLQETRWSTARIVEAVGYSDLPSFARLFASIVGETPAMYRRRAAPANDDGAR